MMPILKEYDFDILITHNRFTLININAEPMIDLAQQRNITVMNAAPYCGGALAKGADNFKRYVYQQADDRALTPLKAVEKICAKHGVDTGAAALQFSLLDSRIAATICGVSKPARVADTLNWAAQELPDALWQDLQQLERSNDDPEASREYKSG